MARQAHAATCSVNKLLYMLGLVRCGQAGAKQVPESLQGRGAPKELVVSMHCRAMQLPDVVVEGVIGLQAAWLLVCVRTERLICHCTAGMQPGTF